MFSIFYIIRCLRRDRSWLVVAALVICLTVAMALLRYSITVQEEKLEALQTDFPIFMELTDINGVKSDGLDISNHYIWHFTKDGYSHEGWEIKHLVKDVALKHTVLAIANTRPKTEGRTELLTLDLKGITHPNADIALLPENGVTVEFCDDRSWEDFTIDQAVCLVPSELETEHIELMLTDGWGADGSGTGVDNATAHDFEVIGVVYGGDPKSVYCPWVYLVEDGMESSEVLRAVVSDNSQLNELKNRMKRYFTHVNYYNREVAFEFALTIFDSSYIETHSTVTQNIKLLSFSAPIFFLLTTLIGFISGFLILRSRRCELTLLRAMGFSAARTVLLLMAQYLVVSFIGASLFALTAYFVPLFMQGLSQLPIVLLCFFAGILISICKETRKSVLVALRAGE